MSRAEYHSVKSRSYSSSSASAAEEKGRGKEASLAQAWQRQTIQVKQSETSKTDRGSRGIHDAVE